MNLTTLRLDMPMLTSRRQFEGLSERNLLCANPVVKNLESSQKQKNDDNDKRDAYDPRRHVAPLAAVRAPRQSTYERQNQKDNQNSCEHCFLPPP